MISVINVTIRLIRYCVDLSVVRGIYIINYLSYIGKVNRMVERGK